MKNKMKMIMGMALVLGVLFITLSTAPIQAYVTGDANDDLLLAQDQDRLKTHKRDCNSTMLQNQTRNRVGVQDCDCTPDYTQTQYRSRQRIDQCAINRICNCTMNMEQYGYQCKERTNNLGH